jgi:hypothetical protein
MSCLPSRQSLSFLDDIASSICKAFSSTNKLIIQKKGNNNPSSIEHLEKEHKRVPITLGSFPPG